MTRTWYSLPDQEMPAVEGVWRPKAEWGDVYSIVMVDGCKLMADVHDRMPTILARRDWSCWTDGTPEKAFALCQAWRGPLVVADPKRSIDTRPVSKKACSSSRLRLPTRYSHHAGFLDPAKR